MNIGAVTSFNNKSCCSRDVKTFNGMSALPKAEAYPIKDEKIGVLGSTALSGAVGLLTGALTACFTNNRLKIAGVGLASAAVIAFLSWPRNNYNKKNLD